MAFLTSPRRSVTSAYTGKNAACAVSLGYDDGAPGMTFVNSRGYAIPASNLRMVLLQPQDEQPVAS
jgi:hypothetical protein